ncbi:MAG: TonB-dependent receptor, partial [Bacteroidota bacterium]
IFTRAINRANSDNPDFEQIPDYFFYDLNTKLNYDLGEKDRLFISGYFGRDKFGFRDDGFNFDFDWGNTTATARWNHIYNPKMFSNTTFTFSDYNYLIDAAIDDFSFDVGSGIRDYNLKTDFYYSPTPEHNIRFGIGGVHHDFTVSRLEANNETEEEPLFASATNFTAQEFHAYFSDDWDISSRLRMNLGVRMTGFLNQSQFYWGAEPRVSARYSVTDNISLKGSYTRMYQYIHLVSNSGATLPTDVWYPSTPGVKPQIADQVAAGLTIAINDDLVFTNELYYKWLQRSLDFRDGADLFVNPNLEEEFVFGRGYAYGNEIYLEKTKGKLTGWIGYTLAWSWREFPDISNGERFRPRFDRRHDISIVAIWELSRKLSLTGTWVYNTGQAYTLPTGWTLLQDTPGQEPQTVVLYTDRNQERQPSYHRLDIGLVWKFYPRWGESDLTIGFYNAYDRRNPYFIFFDVIENPDTGIPEEIQPTQVSLFPVLPSITYNFKF